MGRKVNFKYTEGISSMSHENENKMLSATMDESSHDIYRKCTFFSKSVNIITRRKCCNSLFQSNLGDYSVIKNFTLNDKLISFRRSDLLENACNYY